ncbi:hypothetical protein PGQ11_003390 [Apiospora arundinis]|uniref:Uncharacterized protein n=1 Tax=Apiospora arundinis TaxID=335852 RepID=A0ABR2J5P4_9PEZI
MVLCLSAVTSSTVLLFYANNRPLTDYSFFISFNTLISILAAVARATLAFTVGSCLGQWKWNWFSMRPDTPIVFGSFEDASRGPLGSFWLLCHIRVRHWVSIGAFVTLLMLGFEPFMQALIYYEGRLVNTQPQNAPSIGVSSRLDIGLSRRVHIPGVAGFTYQNKTYQVQQGTFRTEASPGFASALYRGLHSNDPRDVVSVTCSTGNCTWPFIFTSLSVCSSCNDVSDQLKASRYNGTDLGTISQQGTTSGGEYLTHAIPYVSLTNIAKQTSIGVTGRREGYETTLDAYMSAKSLDNPGHTLTFSSLDTMIVAVGLIRAEPAYANETKGWNETQVIATECALYFCANAYRSGVRGGKLYEDIVASWSNRVPGSYFPSDNHDAWGDIYSAEYRNDMWHTYEQYINHSLSTTGAYHLLDDLQLQIPKEEVARYEVRDNVTLLFNVTQNTIESTLPIFKNFFSDPLIYGKSEFGSVTASTLYRSANLSETFAGAARATTYWIRDNSNQTQAGTQEEWVLHIRVRWPYVTLPILVVLLGCGFVFLSMWETRRLRLRPWKTDVLATLAHALDADSREQLRRAARQGRTREEAKGMVLHFEDNNDEGLELKAHDDERPSD